MPITKRFYPSAQIMGEMAYQSGRGRYLSEEEERERLRREHIDRMWAQQEAINRANPRLSLRDSMRQQTQQSLQDVRDRGVRRELRHEPVRQSNFERRYTPQQEQQWSQVNNSLNYVNGEVASGRWTPDEGREAVRQLNMRRQSIQPLATPVKKPTTTEQWYEKNVYTDNQGGVWWTQKDGKQEYRPPPEDKNASAIAKAALSIWENSVDPTTLQPTMTLEQAKQKADILYGIVPASAAVPAGRFDLAGRPVRDMSAQGGGTLRLDLAGNPVRSGAGGGNLLPHRTGLDGRPTSAPPMTNIEAQIGASKVIAEATRGATLDAGKQRIADEAAREASTLNQFGAVPAVQGAIANGLVAADPAVNKATAKLVAVDRWISNVFDWVSDRAAFEAYNAFASEDKKVTFAEFKRRRNAAKKFREMPSNNPQLPR